VFFPEEPFFSYLPAPEKSKYLTPERRREACGKLRRTNMAAKETKNQLAEVKALVDQSGLSQPEFYDRSRSVQNGQNDSSCDPSTCAAGCSSSKVAG
jgi:hypothetical protein